MVAEALLSAGSFFSNPIVYCHEGAPCNKSPVRSSLNTQCRTQNRNLIACSTFPNSCPSTVGVSFPLVPSAVQLRIYNTHQRNPRNSKNLERCSTHAFYGNRQSTPRKLQKREQQFDGIRMRKSRTKLQNPWRSGSLSYGCCSSCSDAMCNLASPLSRGSFEELAVPRFLQALRSREAYRRGGKRTLPIQAAIGHRLCMCSEDSASFSALKVLSPITLGQGSPFSKPLGFSGNRVRYQERRIGEWSLEKGRRGPKPLHAWWDKWFGRGGINDFNIEENNNERDNYENWRERGEGEKRIKKSWSEKILDDLLYGEGVFFEKETETDEGRTSPSPGKRLSRRQRIDLIGGPDDNIDEIVADEEKFRKWQLKRDTLRELKEYQVSGRDPDDDSWEDWIDDSIRVREKLGGWYEAQPDWESGGIPRSPPKVPERGMSWSFKEFFLKMLGREEEIEAELSFEERVFRFTSQTTAKFFSFLVVFPILTGYLVHDFALVPFIGRWVETTPLVAKMLDVRESQKLIVIEELKLERQRVRFEAEIGKTSPLDDEELAEHMHEEALELLEEVRAENRSAFANIWSDVVVGLTGFAICVLNPKQVAIMRMTGDRIFTNISDTGKAFVIILCTDIFLGYHSESGWETVIDMFLEHYGLESDQASIYIFVATVPVTLDVCFKLWVFRYLNRLSPSAAATFREMKRH